MRLRSKLLPLIGLIILFGPACYTATITGTVKGPDGAPFEGAFVQAQNTKTRMAFIVLTDSQGRYRVEKVPAGEYQLTSRATGYRGDPRPGVILTADQDASFDFALQKAPIRWNELSIYQAKQLLPASTGKDTLFAQCFVCHGFQTRMASARRDADGWQDRVQYMRDAMHFVYVEYEMPGPSRMPFSAAPNKDGYLWIPNFGIANKITRLDPKTGAMEDFPVPYVGTAAVHSAVEAPDGSVWLTEQGPNKLGKWDPKTQKITEYQAAYLPGKEGIESAGSKHTVRFDPHGNVWSTGYPLSRLDPEKGKSTDFWGVAGHTYGLEPDKDGNIWFTNPGTGQIGKVDWKTLKIKQWDVPTKDGYERRIELDSSGIVWFGEFQNGKIGRFDPKNEAFKEYDLPGGKDVFPYGVGIDADNNVWYSSYYMDVLGRLDPKTGKITEYPFPHSENTIRELFRDAQGRMWYGSPSNNRVGYFYLTGSSAAAAK